MVISVGVTGAPVSVTRNEDQLFEIIINYECSFNSVAFGPLIAPVNLPIDGSSHTLDPGLIHYFDPPL
jgi:hypothetical protein